MTDLKEITIRDAVILLASSLLIFLTLFNTASSSIIATDISQNLIPIIHTKHNSYFHLTSLGYWASSSVGSIVLIILGLIGTTASLSYHRISPSISLAVSSILFGVITQIFEYDFIIVAPITSISWLYLIICTANSSKLSFLVLLSTMIFALWLLLYAISLPTLLATILLYVIVNNSKLETPIKIVLFLGSLALFILTAFSPDLPWPDYPAHSRITALIAAPPWQPRPLIGEDLAFTSTDRASVISKYEFLLLPLAFTILFSILLIRYRPVAQRAWGYCATLLAISYLDLRLPEEFAQIAPALSFPRLIPELSLTPCTPIALSFVVAGLTLMIMLSILRSNVGALLGVLLVSSFILFTNRNAPHQEPILAAQEWTNSPSRFTTNFFGVDVIKTSSLASHSVRPRTQNIKVTSSNSSPVDIKAILDRDPKTRWTSSNGKQDGSEWLMLELIKPQKFIGIELQTGAFATDFPRGLSIKVGKNCDKQQLEQISNFSNWQGYPKLSTNGYPYFSAQSDVKVFFPREVEVACFLIEQTAVSNNFDWSIAELKLIKKDMPEKEL